MVPHPGDGHISGSETHPRVWVTPFEPVTIPGMLERSGWHSRYEAELQRGVTARAEGNEGMARVCARRAAGVLVRAYFERSGRAAHGRSVLNLLRMLADAAAESDEIRELAGLFVLQITEDHVLPGDIDLLDAAERLREALFGRHGA